MSDTIHKSTITLNFVRLPILNNSVIIVRGKRKWKDIGVVGIISTVRLYGKAEVELRA